MKQYKDLDLKSIVKAAGLDFARWTYGKGQCSCCYGPLDMPAKYWKDGKKPEKVFLDEEHTKYKYVLEGREIKEWDICCILFKNADNGSGTVTKNDFIKDHTCVGYNKLTPEQMRIVYDMLQEQLGDEYEVVYPESDFTCIVINVRRDM